MKATGTADLSALAATLGVTIVEGRPVGGHKGEYIHARRLIVLRAGLSRIQGRSTLAHELGHATYGDTPTGDHRYDAMQEARADRYAATLLIREHAVRAAERLHGPSWGVIAREIGVTDHLLAVWRGLHQRASVR